MARSWTSCLILLGLLPGPSSAQSGADALASVEAKVAAAEASLREGEMQIAESRYRDALFEGWMLMGALNALESELPEAREAFRRASTSVVQAGAALKSLAIVHLQMGESAEAVGILSRLAVTTRRSPEIVRLLAQALASSGEPEQAVQELEEARAGSPGDPELAFLLASGYVRIGKLDAAETLFAEVLAARPLPQTHVLIGRTYRDSGRYDRARVEFEAALSLDPQVRRAHYYLGTLAVLSEGGVELDEAIREFRQELALAPEDPLTNLCLGMSLVEARRCEEALPALELAARADYSLPQAFQYLAQCQLDLDRPAEAIRSFELALSRAGEALDPGQLGSIHYQLGLAHRKLGAAEEAARHFEEAERAAETRVERSRERLARFLSNVSEPQSLGSFLSPPFVSTPLSALAPDERRDAERRATAALARAYFNLGVMQVRVERFARAAEMLEEVVDLDPDFPQASGSLGIAYFNAKQYEKSTGPLARAVGVDPSNVSLRRMLALAWLESGAYDKAAELLKEDAGRSADPSLQFAYGLALVRSEKPEEAEAVFSRLLAEHGITPELGVVLGQAHAYQGDYDAAIEMLQKALALKADVAGASANLGFIYLKLGRLEEAEAALRAELKSHPGDIDARQALATVLDLSGQPDEAVTILRAMLEAKPGFADARYLLGKILLSQGADQEAVAQLEAAVRIAPEDDNIHYQLARAYQKIGRAEDSERHFEIYRRLKDERRERTP